MQNETGFADINGTKIYYTDSSIHLPQTIVMIHAGICDHRMWNTQIAHFAQRYRVLAFDMYGFGQSGTPQAAFAFHEDIVGLLDQRNIDSAWFIAASLGAAITFDIVLMHPRRVNGLILVAPAIAGYRYNGDPHPLAKAIEVAEDANDLERLSELEVQMWVDGEGRKPSDLDPNMRQLVIEMNLIALQTDDVFWEHEIKIDPPALERLSEIDKPTLLIYGDLDVPASLQRVEIITDKITGAEKMLIPDTAHLPNMEQSDAFNQIVDAFMAQNMLDG
ncbi:MAG: alpha/beta fold hydrolase [Anaerolineae bacterium]